MKNLITKVIVALCMMLGSSFTLSMQKAQNPEQATKELHKLLADPSVRHNRNLNTPGLLEKINQLIAQGADVNSVESSGRTPLMRASFNLGNLEIVRALIEAGADVNRQNAQGDTALHQLLKSDFSHALQKGRILIDAGADVNRKNNNGITPLISAAFPGVVNVFKLLVDAGADINAQTINGTTALMALVQGGVNPAGIALLLELGADQNITNNDGKTALDIARDKRYQPNVDALSVVSQKLE